MARVAHAEDGVAVRRCLIAHLCCSVIGVIEGGRHEQGTVRIGGVKSVPFRDKWASGRIRTTRRPLPINESVADRKSLSHVIPHVAPRYTWIGDSLPEALCLAITILVSRLDCATHCFAPTVVCMFGSDRAHSVLRGRFGDRPRSVYYRISLLCIVEIITLRAKRCQPQAAGLRGTPYNLPARRELEPPPAHAPRREFRFRKTFVRLNRQITIRQ